MKQFTLKNLRAATYAAFAAAALVAAPDAKAVAILGFDDVLVQGGTISYNGNPNGTLVGTNILFDQINATGTPLNSGVSLSIVNGLLNFETGQITSESAALDTFGPGGTFTLTGTAFNGAIQIATGNLITGSFTGTPFISFGTQQSNFSAFGIDSKAQGILSFYGITSNNFVFANTDITGATTVAANGSFSANVTNADINNTESVVSVPDSGMTVFLMGVSLLGLVFYSRRVSAMA